MKTLVTFWQNEDGVVTIDWVALSAGILLLGIALIYAIFNIGVASTSASIIGTLQTTANINTGSPPKPSDFK